ncbi:hypothetical protein CVT25_010657 [Psilocybe cyanescens]|uniref:Uncharacterized protein n=1 Tax=Psilocybe cyanescens TaxID=93625 RepID=A0A409WJT2_PSICY|nr:hypothetical protein CVT25_010657 [Psilocybe cyanescens]
MFAWLPDIALEDDNFDDPRGLEDEELSSSPVHILIQTIDPRAESRAAAYKCPIKPKSSSIDYSITVVPDCNDELDDLNSRTTKASLAVVSLTSDVSDIMERSDRENSFIVVTEDVPVTETLDLAASVADSLANQSDVSPFPDLSMIEQVLAASKVALQRERPLALVQGGASIPIDPSHHQSGIPISEIEPRDGFRTRRG